jgi:hypothetical protein
MKFSLKILSAGVFLFGILITGCDKDNDSEAGIQPIVAKASGDSAAIITSINQFRAVLGDPLNTAPGATAGRREVNWDGVPANFTNNESFPLDFFNNTDPAGPNGRKRGLVYINTGSPLRLDSSNFAEVDASYADEFIPFSKKRAIAAVNSTVSEITFKIPGTATDAYVHGFGIIFSDVENAQSAYIELFSGNQSLGVFTAPAKNATGGFSFLGVYSSAFKITRVKITSGNGALGAGVKDISDGGLKDLVVYDDFFYDEPKQLQ